MVDVTLWWIKIIEHPGAGNPHRRFEVLIKGKGVSNQGKKQVLGLGRTPVEAYQHAVQLLSVKPFLVPDTMMPCPQCKGLGENHEDDCPHAR